MLFVSIGVFDHEKSTVQITGSALSGTEPAAPGCAGEGGSPVSILASPDPADPFPEQRLEHGFLSGSAFPRPAEDPAFSPAPGPFFPGPGRSPDHHQPGCGDGFSGTDLPSARSPADSLSGSQTVLFRGYPALLQYRASLRPGKKRYPDHGDPAHRCSPGRREADPGTGGCRHGQCPDQLCPRYPGRMGKDDRVHPSGRTKDRPPLPGPYGSGRAQGGSIISCCFPWMPGYFRAIPCSWSGTASPPGTRPTKEGS